MMEGSEMRQRGNGIGLYSQIRVRSNGS